MIHILIALRPPHADVVIMLGFLAICLYVMLTGPRKPKQK